MIRPVAGTVLARVVITVLNLLLMVVGGHALGAEGLGAISLIVLAITIILLLNHLVGGSGLVYLVPRFGVYGLLVRSYGWAVFTALVAFSAQQLVPLVPTDLVIHVVALAFLQSLNSIHLNILVGRERIGLQNGILVVQAATQLVAFTILLRVGSTDLLDYVWATYIAHGTTAIVSGYFTLRERHNRSGDPGSALQMLFRQGGLAQVANLMQLLNYRFAYYLIERYRDLATLGTFSVTTQLAEGTWLVPKSIGGVLYSKVSNLAEAERQRDVTLILYKTAVIVGASFCAVLLLIPSAFYSWIFGPEIRGLHPILLWMVPGLLAMSGSQVLSHYLSGTGRVHHNTVGSALGLLVTVPLGFALIPGYGLIGAAITSSVAYTASVAYQTVVFLRLTGTSWLELFPHAGDGQRAKQVWTRIRGRLVG